VNALIRILAVILNATYKVCCLFPRRNLVLLCSRQSDSLSGDYAALKDEFKQRGWEVKALIMRLDKKHVLRFTTRMFCETYYLARCKVCFLDGGDPVVSLLSFNTEALSADSPLFTEVPAQPLVVQLWHAFGSFKKFGYQAFGGQEARSSSFAESVHAHRNYSWVVCTGEESRKIFSEAFRCPKERVIPLGRPTYDQLIEQRDLIGRGNSILMAPTLRKSPEADHPFKQLQNDLPASSDELAQKCIWSFHPLENGGASDSVRELCACSCLVTDYSSLVYDAYLLNTPVFFYVPDITEYLQSPGLNRNPLEICPEITATTKEELFGLLLQFNNAPEEYDFNALNAFIGNTFTIQRPDVAKQIADFCIEKLAQNNE